MVQYYREWELIWPKWLKSKFGELEKINLNLKIVGVYKYNPNMCLPLTLIKETVIYAVH